MFNEPHVDMPIGDREAFVMAGVFSVTTTTTDFQIQTLMRIAPKY